MIRQTNGSGKYLDLYDLLPLLGRVTMLVLHPRFSESVLPAPRATDLHRAAALVGRTLPALQVWDVMRAVSWALEDRKLRPAAIHVYGRGEAGIVGLYAAVLEERINQVVLSDPPESHLQGPPLLGVLRHTDIPEVAGLIAPRRLSFLSRVPAGFALTRQMYAVSGAEASVACCDSLSEAVLGV